MERARRPTDDDTPGDDTLDDLLVGGVGGLIVGAIGGAIAGPAGVLLGTLGCLLTLASALLFGTLWLDRRWPGDDER